MFIKTKRFSIYVGPMIEGCVHYDDSQEIRPNLRKPVVASWNADVSVNLDLKNNYVYVSITDKKYAVTYEGKIKAYKDK